MIRVKTWIRVRKVKRTLFEKFMVSGWVVISMILLLAKPKPLDFGLDNFFAAKTMLPFFISLPPKNENTKSYFTF